MTICKRHKNKKLQQDSDVKNAIQASNSLYNELEHTKSIIHKLKRVPYHIPNSVYNIIIENKYSVSQEIKLSCNELKYVLIGLELYCDELNNQIDTENLHIKHILENINIDKKLVNKEE